MADRYIELVENQMENVINRFEYYLKDASFVYCNTLFDLYTKMYSWREDSLKLDEIIKGSEINA